MSSRAELLNQLKNSTYTFDWGAIATFDGPTIARRLSEQYALIVHGPAALRPITAKRIDIIGGGSGYITLEGVVLAAPSVSFSSYSLQHSRMRVSFELVKGSYTERSLPLGQPEVISRIVNLGVGRSYTFSFELEINLMEGSIDRYGSVELKLGEGIDPSSDLGTSRDARQTVANFLFEQINLRYASGATTLPLGWIETQRGHTLPGGFRIRTQANPNSTTGEGAVVLLIAGPSGHLGREPSDAALPYLIPDENHANGATIIVSREYYPKLLEGEAPDLLGQLLFPRKNYFSQTERYSDAVDEVYFGRMSAATEPQQVLKPKSIGMEVPAQIVSREVGRTPQVVMISASTDTSQTWNWSMETPGLGTLAIDGASAVYTPPETLLNAAKVAVQRITVWNAASGATQHVCIVLHVGSALATMSPALQPAFVPGNGISISAAHDYTSPGVTETWTVVGQGTCDDGYYEAPADVSNDIDVVVYECSVDVGGGIMFPLVSGYSIVQFDKTVKPKRWTQLTLKITAVYPGERVYANGMQQVGVDVSWDTGVEGAPLLPEELATLRLVFKDGREVPLLPRTIEGLTRPAEGSGEQMTQWAVSRDRNRFRLTGEKSTFDPVAAPKEMKIEHFYLHTLSATPAEFAVALTDIENREHTSYTGTAGDDRLLRVEPRAVPNLTSYQYDTTNTRVRGGWTGDPNGPDNPNLTPENPDNQWNFVTVDYWQYQLIYDQEQLQFLRLQWEEDGPGVRWEVPKVGPTPPAEDAFSYLGYMLVPVGQAKPTHLRYATEMYNPILYNDPAFNGVVPNSDLDAVHKGAPGTLLIALHRELDIFYRQKAKIAGFDLERPTIATLWDQNGTRHRNTFGFAGQGRDRLARNTESTMPSSAAPGNLAASTAVHSNAFNFMSFIESGVDPRTGQYTLAISLPALQSYDLNGPQFPLALSYNPLNTANSGYGQGWDLRLSQYTPGTGILSLSTGETFKSTDTQGGQLLFKEQKIDSFRCFDDGNGWYRVVHKSGLVEYLKVRGITDHEVAVPQYMESPQGHRLTLSYANFGDYQRLQSVRDASNTLLEISSDRSFVHIDVRPGAVESVNPWARYTLHLGDNGRVDRISLPSDPASSWRFTYEPVKGIACLKTVGSPTGALETLYYDDDGHLFPDGTGTAARLSAGGAPLSDRAREARERLELHRAQRNSDSPEVAQARAAARARTPLPRVTRHVTDPGFSQPAIDVRYSYALNGQDSVHNFLGAGLKDVIFEDNGLDNIYKTSEPYLYGSVETLWDTDGPVRSITRTFNRYHLLVEEATKQNDSIKRVSTTYHIEEGKPFDLQPPQVQLPRKVATTWTDMASGQAYTEEEHSSFDVHGNPVETIAANRVREVSTWYRAEGEEGCPPHPYGFVSQLREQTTYPADFAYADTPVLRTRYRYARQNPIDLIPYEWGEEPPVPGSFMPWLAPVSELQTNVANDLVTEVQVSFTDYIDEPRNPTKHGRPQTMRSTLGGVTRFPTTGAPVTEGGYTSSVAFTYEKKVADGRLKTVETTTTFDGLSKVITREASVLTANPLLDQDDNGVEIETQYNALDQVIAEIAAPNTPERAMRGYSYRLVNAPGEQASQCVIDVKGVETHTYFDGLNRAIREERQQADSPARASELLQTYAASYNSLGQLVSETMFDARLGDAPIASDTAFTKAEWDWTSEQSLALTTTFTYDDWGQQCSATGPDGVVDYEQTDPVTQVTETWRAGIGKTRTKTNLFDKPDWIERRTLAGGIYSRETSAYDGLGRLRAEKDAQGNETTYTYDIFDRLISNGLPGGAVVKREFAAHSSEDLPTSIGVVDASKTYHLGTQAFDGLSRLTWSVTGNRHRENIYNSTGNQPDFVRTPGGHVIAYTYKPHLSDEPVTRQIEGGPIAAVYGLDQHNARLLSGTESGHGFEREFFSTGELKSEKRTDAGGEHAMSYIYSLRGRLLSYTDVLGNTQTNSYDLAGRMSGSRLGTTHTALTYNPVGLNDGINTEDEALHQQVKISLEYDEQGRESLRTFDLGGGLIQELAQGYSLLDQMTTRSLSEGGTVLRDEEFSYDARGRLDLYLASGSEVPVDPANKRIRMQLFVCDAIDNHEVVLTDFEEADGSLGTDEALYRYSASDPAQLVEIIHDHPDYQRFNMTLRYDANGCLLEDEEGRALEYDALSRLVRVSSKDADEYVYGYDAQDIISRAAGESRFYCAGQLFNLVDPNGDARTIMRVGESPVAEHQAPGAANDPQAQGLEGEEGAAGTPAEATEPSTATKPKPKPKSKA